MRRQENTAASMIMLSLIRYFDNYCVIYICLDMQFQTIELSVKLGTNIVLFIFIGTQGIEEPGGV